MVATAESRPLERYRLRPYQVEAARAVLDSVFNRRGLTISVEMARQGGKNELSAQLEAFLLVANMLRDVESVKCAPTLEPQCRISMRRLWARLGELGLAAISTRQQGRAISVGKARQLFLSAERESNVVGHTAQVLLEVDEAQDVDAEKFDKEFRPMAASTGATTVLYGTAWDDRTLLERTKHANLEAERRDGVRRHFEYDWQRVAQHNAAYARFVEAERLRLGESHPLFLTQYCLRPLHGGGRLFDRQQRAQLPGHARPTIDAAAGRDLRREVGYRRSGARTVGGGLPASRRHGADHRPRVASAAGRAGAGAARRDCRALRLDGRAPRLAA